MRKIMSITNNTKNRDPFVVKHNGKYYYCFSNGNSISLICADSIEDIEKSEPKIVFVPDKEEYSKELWAPELHVIDDKCYIYVACDNGNNYNHRMYVLENNSNDPMDCYKMHGKISDSTDRWAIDGNLIKYKGDMYYFWSGWDGTRNVRQNIYIAKMKNPYELSSERVMISTPTYDWEKIGCTPEDTEGKPYINEGPFAFVLDDILYLAYSASGCWNTGYCLAFLKLIGNNPLDPSHWYKFDKPTLTSNELVLGPGHCSIIKDDNKNIIFFHGWESDCKEIISTKVCVWQGELELIDGKFLIK